MDNYEYVRIDVSSIKLIRQLYGKAFNLYPSADYLQKKYDTNYFGLRDIGFLALDQNHLPAAYYGAFPLVFRINGKDYLAAQSGDTMTDPAHQKRGLFVRLAKMTYELAIQEKIHFVFGFPNQNSFPGFERKLDWKFYDYMYNFNLSTNSLPLCEISFKLPFFRKLYKSYVRWVLKKWEFTMNEDVINCFNSGNPVGYVKKDMGFFKYKLNEDSYLLMLKGFLIFLKVDDHLKIGDVSFFAKDRLGEFIKVIKKLGLKFQSRKVVFSVNKNHWLYHYLNEYEAPEIGLPIGFYVINEDIPYSELSFTLADFDTF